MTLKHFKSAKRTPKMLGYFIAVNDIRKNCKFVKNLFFAENCKINGVFLIFGICQCWLQSSFQKMFLTSTKREFLFYKNLTLF